jgi:hypothetical protein
MRVSLAPEVPRDAPLVVRSKRNTRVLYVLMLFSAGLCVAEIVAIPSLVVLGGPGLLPLLSLGPLLFLQLWLTLRIVAEYQGLLTPHLAAGPAGLWVRTGTGRRPQAVFLPWQAIDGVDTTRKGPAVRILSREGEALFGKRAHWRVRTLRRRFGTSFVVDGRRSAEPVDVVAQRIHAAARAPQSP